MRYKLLGRSGLRVSELCLGTLTFGEDWGFGASREECRAIFEAFTAAGGNFIDTACNYTFGSSEQIVGELVASDRDRFVIGSKFTMTTNPKDPNRSGNHRKNLVTSVSASLKRLGTDYLDLLWLHQWDFTTSVEEVMRGLDDLVRSGKVLYVGVSDTPAWIISRANMLADLRGWSPFAALQLPYSLAERTAERELLPMARELDLAVTTWGALAGGALSGKYAAGAPRPPGTRLFAGPFTEALLTERNFAIAAVVAGVAAEIGQSPSTVALAWILHQRSIAQLLPIVGARSAAQMKENLGALETKLSPEHLARLDEATRVPLGFPHDFLVSERGYLFGEVYPLLDNHRSR